MLGKICRETELKNRFGRRVNAGNLRDGDGALYCGVRGWEAKACPCGRCDGVCGPSGGCPCAACESLMVQAMRLLGVGCGEGHCLTYTALWERNFMEGKKRDEPCQCAGCERVLRYDWARGGYCAACQKMFCVRCVLKGREDGFKKCLEDAVKEEMQRDEKHEMIRGFLEGNMIMCEAERGDYRLVCSRGRCSVWNPCQKCRALVLQLCGVLAVKCPRAHTMVCSTLGLLEEAGTQLCDFTCANCHRVFADQNAFVVNCRRCNVHVCLGCVLAQTEWRDALTEIVSYTSSDKIYSSTLVPVHPSGYSIEGKTFIATNDYASGRLDVALERDGVLATRVRFTGSVNSIGVIPVSVTSKDYMWKRVRCGFYNGGAGFNCPRVNFAGVMDVRLDLDQGVFTLRSRGREHTMRVPDSLRREGPLTIGFLCWESSTCRVYDEDEQVDEEDVGRYFSSSDFEEELRIGDERLRRHLARIRAIERSSSSSSPSPDYISEEEEEEEEDEDEYY